jgi:hypothetical protein
MMLNPKTVFAALLLCVPACGGNGSNGSQCIAQGASCSGGAMCCPGLTCTNSFCAAAGTKKFGEACSKYTECESMLCNIVCTSVCNGDQDCSGQGAGYLCMKYDVLGQGGLVSGNHCALGCRKTSDCSALIDPTWSCDVPITPTASGTLHGVCGEWQMLDDGFGCLDQSQCTSGVCDPRGFCTYPCTADSDCGLSAECVTDADAISRCRPDCIADSDCAVFQFISNMPQTCKVATTRGGSSVKICM